MKSEWTVSLLDRASQGGFVKQAIIIIASLMMLLVLPKPSVAQNEKDILPPEGLRLAALSRVEAWNTREIPKIMERERDLVEFGTNLRKPRYKRDFSEQEFRSYLQDWFAKRPSIEFIPKNWDLAIVENTGLIWGSI